jgi:hypothetical protein
MKPVIFYRSICKETEEEIKEANKYFYTTNSRIDIQKDDLVICRYSARPFVKEVENDINKLGAKLINSYQQQEWVADIREWYEDLVEYTPKTWFFPHLISEREGSFVLKGKTNSRKFLWKTHMFAETWKDIMPVYCRLLDDTLIGSQDIYVRKFIPLKTYFTSFHDLPVSKEFRFFVAYGEILTGEFYWSNSIEEIIDRGFDRPNVEEVPKDLLQKLINIISPNINFFVMDVAQTADGEWILIELNDGQMSGLSENSASKLYENLKKVIGKQNIIL